ncbi:MAG: LCP family protein [Lachnospiraceae bacterium]|nr:LCP family protein [Lachnospiraceae bacterium]
MKGKAGKTEKKNKLGKIAMCILSTILILLLSLGLVGIIVYKSGEMELKASASASAPQIDTDEEEVERIRESLQYADTVAWQDDWVVYDGKVYEYREDMLNFLLLGIDRSGSLSTETELSDWSAGQADTIFLVTLNQEDKAISVIGIPRNSMVDVEIFNSEKECIETIHDQICLQYGYAGGGELGLDKMKESVSELFCGLPLHGACAVSFDAVSAITDRLGGIEVVVPDDMTAYNSSYIKGSTQTLTGKNVVGYLRYRNYSELGSPTTRLERQKAFMKAAADDVMQAIKENPMFVKEIYELVKPYMNTDISVDEAVYISAKALDCGFSEQSFYQLTGEDKAVYFTDDNGNEDFYDDYYLDEDELKEIMMNVFYKEVKVSD